MQRNAEGEEKAKIGVKTKRMAKAERRTMRDALSRNVSSPLQDVVAMKMKH